MKKEQVAAQREQDEGDSERDKDEEDEEEEEEQQQQRQQQQEPYQPKDKKAKASKKSITQAAIITLRAMAQKRASGAARRGDEVRAESFGGIKKRPAGSGAEAARTSAGAVSIGGTKRNHAKDSATEMPAVKPPSCTNERSRSQVLFRSGLVGKGQSEIRRYTDKASEVAAVKWGQAQVREERRRRGLD